ncbi:hypothetical protein [Streptomyces sp. NPDC001401]|uniref:hypothetical protein n=1 Tax=Streptomyces sp. NPDC001401 TaxID=3364570 RepID=UPI003681B2FA
MASADRGLETAALVLVVDVVVDTGEVARVHAAAKASQDAVHRFSDASGLRLTGNTGPIRTKAGAPEEPAPEDTSPNRAPTQTMPPPWRALRPWPGAGDARRLKVGAAAGQSGTSCPTPSARE